MRNAACSMALVLVACGSAPPGAPAPDTLAAPARGVQVKTGGVVVPAGTEVEWCEVVTLPGAPGDALWVRRIEAVMAGGSHHLIVSAIEPGSEMEARLADGHREECPLGARQLGEEIEELFGSQAPYWDEDLPAGVGRKLQAGQKLIIDYHYFNATRADLDAKIALNLHTAGEGEIDRLVHTGGYFNVTIRVPPRELLGFTGECRMSEDLVLYKLIRHTHKWGRRFSVWFSGGPRDGELAFESTHYEETDRVFEAPLSVRAGEGFRFECEYLNTESHELVFGNTVRDEMCILFFSYWSPEPGRELPVQGCFLTEIDPDGIARP